MTIVTSTFSWNYGQPWCSSASATTEPWYKINAQLANWIAGIGDSNKISMAVNPSQNTTLNSNTDVGWILRMPEADVAGAATCIDYMRRAGNSTYASPTYYFTYTGWAAGSANNGRGSYSANNYQYQNMTALPVPTSTLNNTLITTYEADVSLPWFTFTQLQGYLVWNFIIARLDVSTNSIPTASDWPSTGLAPWAVIYMYQGDMGITTVSGLANTVYPPKGTSYSSVLTFTQTGQTFPKVPGYLFRTRPMMADAGPIGAIKDDLFLLSASNTAYLETVVVGAKTYTRISNYILMRIA
jgi:hypothetical protein